VSDRNSILAEGGAKFRRDGLRARRTQSIRHCDGSGVPIMLRARLFRLFHGKSLLSMILVPAPLDFFRRVLATGGQHRPGGTCRTDASVDAEVSDLGVSPELDPGVGAPSGSEPPAVDVPVVPVMVEVTSDSEGPLVAVASAVPLVPAELADAVSSASAIPGVVATAIPTPSATANPPTRPMYLALPMMIPPRFSYDKWR
jgi:hypothetical protein